MNVLSGLFSFMDLDFSGDPDLDTKEHSGKFEDLAREANYYFEKHCVITQDAHVLQMFRLPLGKNESMMNLDQDKPVVFLQHGVLDSADTWILNGKKSIGFQLADLGYDVWLGNIRGNKYCLAKVGERDAYLKKSFWDFTWQDSARYDLKAMFDYVYDKTNRDIIYIGHSQGCIMMWAALGDPETSVYFNNRVKLFIAVGPALFIDNTKSKLLRFCSENTSVIAMASKVYSNGFLLPSQIQRMIYSNMSETVSDRLTKVAMELVCEDYSDQICPEVRRRIWHHLPAGTSLKNLHHWAQMIKTGEFKKYDFENEEKNLDCYGQRVPPKYTLSTCKVPVGIFAGVNDKISNVSDLRKLRNTLKAESPDSLVCYHEYEIGHVSILWNKDIDYFLDIIDLIQSIK